MLSNGLQLWLQKTLACKDFHCNILAGDASFRRYYRVNNGEQSYVAMDAGQDKNTLKAFVAIAKTLSNHDVLAPQIYEQDLSKGFVLLSDFGDTLYLDELNRQTADSLYQIAFETLLRMQSIQTIDNYTLPLFDRETYLRELNLFREWYLTQQMGLALTTLEHQLLDEIDNLLINEAINQPQVFVHRDYHSRNLMVVPPDQVGILDFQDALMGPITYDLLSLLRDCYIDWPKPQVTVWVKQFFHALNAKRETAITEFDQFLTWFDHIGLQRHFKCVGIFARLSQRDHKPQYCEDIPRILNYMRDVIARYPHFKELNVFLKKRKIIA